MAAGTAKLAGVETEPIIALTREAAQGRGLCQNGTCGESVWGWKGLWKNCGCDCLAFWSCGRETVEFWRMRVSGGRLISAYYRC
ncbi:MAG: hypothetical protein ACLSHU_03600 [Oscillospiraceae bacterium]